MNFIFDAHSCLPLSPKASLETLHRYRLKGTRYISINVGMDFNPLSQIMTVIASFRRQIAEDPLFIQAQSIADVHLAVADNRLAVGFDLEGSVPLLDNLDMISLYKQLGITQIHLAYNRSNSAAGGCHDQDKGLTPLGKQMVYRIQEEGIIMDMSHNGLRTTLDICAHAHKPVIFSHANAYQLVPHPRNITDEQILACASTNGVICINGVGRFLGTATPENMAKHCAYVAEKVGVSHVGIGLDTMLDQAGINDMPPHITPEHWWPKEHYPSGIGGSRYIQPEQIPDIIHSLQHIGFHASEIQAILWNNMMRIADECW